MQTTQLLHKKTDTELHINGDGWRTCHCNVLFRALCNHAQERHVLLEMLCVDMSFLSPSTSRDHTQRGAGINHDMSCVLHEHLTKNLQTKCVNKCSLAVFTVHNVWSFCGHWTQIKKSVHVERVAIKSFETNSSRLSTSLQLWRSHLTFHLHISNMSPTFTNFHFHEQKCVEPICSFTNRLDLVWVELTINIIVSSLVLML